MESIQTINKRLEDNYGKLDLQPHWRVVFSEDMLEKRLGTYNDFTREGIFLRTVTEVREVPKYRQWIHNKFVLERLTAVPIFQQDEVLSQLSYEPIWVFEDVKGNPLPPKWEAIELIIMSVYGSMSGGYYPKYVEPFDDKQKRIQQLEEQLFGNETEIGDALAYHEGVGYTNVNSSMDGTESAQNSQVNTESTGQIDGGINIPKGN